MLLLHRNSHSTRPGHRGDYVERNTESYQAGIRVSGEERERLYFHHGKFRGHRNHEIHRTNRSLRLVLLKTESGFAAAP